MGRLVGQAWLAYSHHRESVQTLVLEIFLLVYGCSSQWSGVQCSISGYLNGLLVLWAPLMQVLHTRWWVGSINSFVVCPQADLCLRWVPPHWGGGVCDLWVGGFV